MHRPLPESSVSPPRRFLLLPEESVGSYGQGLRIRRYQLASIARRPGLGAVDVATARMVREFARVGHM